jgi:hypothetical protein
LGSPEGIIAVAQRVRQLRDASKVTERTAQALIQGVGRAARAASHSDKDAVDRQLQELSDAVASASGTELDQDSAAELGATIEALRAPALVTEAETMDRLGAACLRTDHTNYTGSGFVACLKAAGNGVRIEGVTGDGSYDMVIRYANAMGSTRTMTVVAGDTSTQVDFANLANWDTWSESSLKVTLTPGDDVTVFYGPGDNGNVNIDSISLKPRLGVVIDSAT